MFCLFYNVQTKKVHALNGSGRYPANGSLEQVRKDLKLAPGEVGSIPFPSALAATTPGAAAGWIDTIEKFGSGKLSLAQILQPPDTLTGAIRAESDPSPLAAIVGREVSALSRDVGVTWVRTMQQQIAAALVSERLLASLSSAFGLLTLLLACIGLYGVLSYDVARRSRDIGIRLALGAHQSMVLRTVLRQTATIAAIGLIAGVIAASLASQYVEAFLFELTPRDPITLVVASAVLAISAMLAGYIPARRASRIDPAVALRAE